MLSGVSLSQCRSTIFTPALLTRISSRLNVVAIYAPTRRTCSLSVRSAGCTCAWPAALWMRRATFSSFSRVRPVRMTVAPSSASARAAASPIPLPAPVIQAIFPARLATGGFLHVHDGPHSRGPAPQEQPPLVNPNAIRQIAAREPSQARVYGYILRSTGQCPRLRPVARRLLRVRHDRGFDLLRDVGYRQHRAPGVHPSGL